MKKHKISEVMLRSSLADMCEKLTGFDDIDYKTYFFPYLYDCFILFKMKIKYRMHDGND